MNSTDKDKLRKQALLKILRMPVDKRVRLMELEAKRRGLHLPTFVPDERDEPTAKEPCESLKVYPVATLTEPAAGGGHPSVGPNLLHPAPTTYPFSAYRTVSPESFLGLCLTQHLRMLDEHQDNLHRGLVALSAPPGIWPDVFWVRS